MVNTICSTGYVFQANWSRERFGTGKLDPVERTNADKHQRLVLLCTHLVMAHVRLGPVQQTLELQTVGVPVGDHIAHLSDYCGEDEYANQVADDREDVSAEGTRGRRYGVRLQCVCLCTDSMRVRISGCMTGCRAGGPTERNPNLIKKHTHGTFNVYI